VQVPLWRTVFDLWISIQFSFLKRGVLYILTPTFKYQQSTAYKNSLELNNHKTAFIKQDHDISETASISSFRWPMGGQSLLLSKIETVPTNGTKIMGLFYRRSTENGNRINFLKVVVSNKNNLTIMTQIKSSKEQYTGKNPYASINNSFWFAKHNNILVQCG
jgi:hypothetical protein